MPLGQDLADAANQSPPVAICHHAVVRWLVRANAITVGEETAVVRETSAHEWGDVLVAYNDTAYTRTTISTAPVGTVLGFFTQNQTLQHSMVYMGGGILAGVNNLGVLIQSVATKVGTKYARVTIDQLNWVDNNRVGINQCIIRGIDPQTVANRIRA